MAKFRKVVRELRDAEVRRISLVDHAANRIPFRIKKRNRNGENEMQLDLASLSIRRILKGEPTPQPEVAALVFPNKPAEPELARLKDVVEKAGLKTDHAVDANDGLFLYQQAEFDPKDEDVRAIALGPNVAVIVKGFKPWAEQLGDFAAVMDAGKFYPGVGNACSALAAELTQKMSKGEDVADTLKAFTGYVSTMARLLPEVALKFDTGYSALQAVLKGERDAAKKAETDAEKAKADAEVARKAALKKPDDVAQEDWDKADADARDQMCQKADKARADTDAAAAKEAAAKNEAAGVDTNALVAALKGAFAGDLAGITNAVAELSTKVAANETALAAVVAKSEAVEKKLNGTVLGDARDDQNSHQQRRETSRKGDGPFGGASDTAYAPRDWRSRN